MKTVLVI